MATECYGLFIEGRKPKYYATLAHARNARSNAARRSGVTKGRIKKFILAWTVED